MKIGSLCSGIGGLELGLERAGVGHTIWHAETDPFCSQVLAKHWDVPNYGDITTADWSTVERPDLICAGFPCQPVSSAGLRRGTGDERWLWPDVARCIRALGPDRVVLENVADLASDADAFGRVLGDLSELGFDAEWSTLTACTLGAPHTRRRLFVLAHSTAHDGERAVQLPAGVQRGRTEPGGTRGDAWRDWWLSEPDVVRVAHGVPKRLVAPHLRALGNAVVPFVGEFIGQQLLDALAVVS